MPQRVIENPEDLPRLAGQEIAISDWVEIPQPLIEAFAETTGDRQWIHVDEERARRESPYGRTIAHGFLTLSLLSRLKLDALHIGGFRRAINYGLNRVRFPAAAPSGCRIRGRFTLQAVSDAGDSVQLTFLATVEVEGSPKPAVVAEWLLRYYR